MTNSSNEQNASDVLIVGGGPGGLAAFRWCRELGLSVMLLEAKPELGGQLLSIYGRVENYLGRKADSGRELCQQFLSEINGLELRGRINSRVKQIDISTLTATTDDGRQYVGKAIVIATGVRRRRLGVPGEVEFAGRGVLNSGVRDRNAVVGKHVAVIGGGDAALENAIILSAVADEVTVIHRRERLAARSEFVSRAHATSNIRFLLNASVSAISGDDSVRSLTIDEDSRAQHQLAVDAVLIRIGVQPNTELLDGRLETDETGYLIVDGKCRTSDPSVYAVGDVACPTSPTISTAVGMGATAVKSICSWIYRRQTV